MFVKTGSASTTPSTSGVATPSSTAAPASEEKKEDDKDATIVQNQDTKLETAAIPSTTEPVLERCSSAALVRTSSAVDLEPHTDFCHVFSASSSNSAWSENAPSATRTSAVTTVFPKIMTALLYKPSAKLLLKRT